MTFLDLINSIEDIAKRQPNIHTLVGIDVTRLNALPNAKYSVFAWTAGQHRREGNVMLYSLNLWYIDRLTADSRNEIGIQSAGISILNNIIDTLLEEHQSELELYGNIYYNDFEQRFSDLCAGIYTSLTIAVPITDCYEEY